jgi:hypothetical protein
MPTAMFLKNVTMLGGALLISQLAAGSLSLVPGEIWLADFEKNRTAKRSAGGE